MTAAAVLTDAEAAARAVALRLIAEESGPVDVTSAALVHAYQADVEILRRVPLAEPDAAVLAAVVEAGAPVATVGWFESALRLVAAAVLGSSEEDAERSRAMLFAQFAADERTMLDEPARALLRTAARDARTRADAAAAGLTVPQLRARDAARRILACDLRELPRDQWDDALDRLVADRALIAEIPAAPEDAAIIRAVRVAGSRADDTAALAASLHAAVVSYLGAPPAAVERIRAGVLDEAIADPRWAHAPAAVTALRAAADAARRRAAEHEESSR